jgi:mycoredoxin
MTDATIVVYGADWCGDCRRAKRYFTSHNIPFQWINIDQDPKAELKVIQMNRGMRSIPTIIFPDGTTMVEPSTLELERKFSTEPSLN